MVPSQAQKTVNAADVQTQAGRKLAECATRSGRRLGCTVMQSVLLVRETVSRGESSRLDAVIPAIRRGPTKCRVEQVCQRRSPSRE